MARGSADRYFQQEVSDTLKLVPEGIEGQVAYKGPLAAVLHQLMGGLRSSMNEPPVIQNKPILYNLLFYAGTCFIYVI